MGYALAESPPAKFKNILLKVLVSYQKEYSNYCNIL